MNVSKIARRLPSVDNRRPCYRVGFACGCAAVVAGDGTKYPWEIVMSSFCEEDAEDTFKATIERMRVEIAKLSSFSDLADGILSLPKGANP